MPAILVTGAAGHLGANLVRELLAQGQEVRAAILDERDRHTLDGLEVQTVCGDLRDPAVAARAVAGVRQAYHCAARISTSHRDRDDIFGCNVIATRNLLRAARDASLDKVVVTGSFSAVGIGANGVSSEADVFDPCARHLPYGQTKAAVEHECLKAFADGLAVVVAVSTAILGPNDFVPSRMGRVLVRFARGRLHAYVPGGFPFVTARDIVQGHLLAMRSGRPGQRYIFASEFKTFDEIMAIFSQVTGCAGPRLRLPPRLMAAVAEVVARVGPLVAPRADQLLTPGAIAILDMHRRADISKARDELGFVPGAVEPAVRDAYDWFCARGMIDAAHRPAPRVEAHAR